MQIRTHWYGIELCLDERHTIELIMAIGVAGGVARFIGTLYPNLNVKIEAAAVGAVLGLGALVLGAVDLAGGGRGVCITKTWAPGPVVPPGIPVPSGWVVPNK